MQQAARAPRRVLLVGGGAPTARLLADLALERDSGLDIIGVVDDAIDDRIDEAVPYCGPLEDIAGSRSTARAGSRRRRGPDRPTGGIRAVARRRRRRVPDGRPAEIYEFAFGRLPVEDLTSAWFMSVLHAYNRPANRLAKRMFDVIVAALRLAVTALVLPAIIILVKNSRGPLLYRQQRLGENGRPFMILKFRSMRLTPRRTGRPSGLRTTTLG